MLSAVPRLVRLSSLPSAPFGPPAARSPSTCDPRDLVVSEVEAVALPPGGPANPHSNGFRMVETELGSTTAAQRVHNFNSARFW